MSDYVVDVPDFICLQFFDYSDKIILSKVSKQFAKAFSMTKWDA